MTSEMLWFNLDFLYLFLGAVAKKGHEENYLGTTKDIVSRTVLLNTEKLYIYNLQW